MAIRLQIWLGLRRKEAIFAYKNLAFWCNELKLGCHRITILGSVGPKNGRPRTITISDHIREPVVELIEELDLWVIENNQVIASGKSAKAAMMAYSKAINSLGFRMPYSTHSFCYGWAINQYKWYIS